MNTQLMKAITSHPPEAIALNDGVRVISYGELQNKVEQVANELAQQNLEALALYADNGTEWVIVDLACQLVGIRIVPIPLFFSQEQIRNLLKRSGLLSAFITDRSWEARGFLRFSSETSLKSLNLQLLKFEEATQTALPEGTAKITFTSGSSGNPKGVCLSQKNQWVTASVIADTLGFNQVKHLSLLPLTTLLENIAGVYAPLIRGGQVILPAMGDTGLRGSNHVDAQKLLDCISSHQPNTLILVPELLLLLVTAAEIGWQVPASLAFIAVGGARVSEALLGKARQLGLPVYQGYGLSECVSVVSLNTPANNQLNSCGKPLSHARISVTAGELYISGNTSLGYAGEPASWYQDSIATGDAGYIDEQGFVHINGRVKNTLVSSYGRNINPEWPESKLLAHPLIQHAVIFGDGKPYCVALIYPRFPESTQKDIQAVVDTCNQTLPDYARIQEWRRLDFPLSVASGSLTENGRPRREEIYLQHRDLIHSSYESLSEVTTA